MHFYLRLAAGTVHFSWLRIFLFVALGSSAAIVPASAQDVGQVIRLFDTLLAPPSQQYEPQRVPRTQRRQRTVSSADGAIVAQVQAMLNALGYDAGPTDGVPGQRTMSAAAQFRSAYGLDASGDIDQSLVAALKVAVNRGNVQPGGVTDTFVQRVEPSFSCAAARTQAERTICASPNLATMDVEITDRYTQLRAAGNQAARDTLRAEQNRWLARREACRADAACIASRMKERSLALATRGDKNELPGTTVVDGRWIGKSVPALGQEARAIAFDRAGIRAVEPVVVDGRLLTGFPVMTGELKGAPVAMRYREVPSTEMALALYLDLAVLKQWPQVLDEPKSTYYLAERFLTGELADQYIVGCPAGCGSSLPYPGWTGADEFEREGSYRRFVDTIVPDLVAQAPSFPIGTRHVIEMELGAYDRTRKAFGLRLNRPGANWDALFGSMGGARRLMVEQEYKLPEELPAEANEAQALLKRLKPGTRYAYLVLDQRLDEPGWHIDRNDPGTKLVVERVRLFADVALTDQIHEFFEEGRAEIAAPQPGDNTAGPMKVEYWRDTVLIGGRVATSIGGLPGGIEDMPKGLNLGGNPVRLVRDYALVQDPSWLDNDASALALIFQLDHPLQVEIIEQAIQQPLSEFEKNSLRLNSGYPMGPVADDPFAKRRALEALRERADRIVPKDLPPQPIPLRVYCYVDLGLYDFDSGSFPISNHGCDGIVDGVGKFGGNGTAEPAPGDMPKNLVLAPEEAERLSKSIAGNNRMFVSFETDMTIRTERSEAGHRTIATFSKRSHFWLHKRNRMTEVLYRLDREAVEPGQDATTVGDAVAGDPDRVWDLQRQEQRAALLEYAQPMGSLPYDGRSMLEAADGNYGTVRGRSSPFNPSPDDPGISGPFFGSPRIDFIPMLANALAVPREHLITMAFVDEREPISGIVALLPAPYETFVRRAPPGSYGQTQMIFETSMELAGVHRFDLPFANPLIVLSARPKMARFITSSYDTPKALETFDLTTAISFPNYEVLAVPTRNSQVVAAAQALGSKVEDVVANTMTWPDGLDVFQKNDIVIKLVEMGKADKADETLWVTGEITMGEYDFATQSFPPQSASLDHIELLRALDLPATSIGFQMADISPLAIGMPPEQARDWAQGFPPYTKVPLRARVRLSEPSLQHRSIGFKIEILEAELLDKDSVATVRDPQRIIYHYPIRNAAITPEPEGEAATAMPDHESAVEVEEPHEPDGRDILGVQLGEQLDAAVTKVGEEFGSSERYFATREARMPQGGITLWESYSTATLIDDPKEQLMVALYTEPPAGENVVTGITRSQAFRPGEGPHPEKLLARLKEKYGEPSQGSQPANGIYYWQSNGGPPCGVLGAVAGYNVQLHLARMKRDAGQQDTSSPAWIDKAGQRWFPLATEPFDLHKVFTRLPDCDDEIVLGIIHTSNDGLTEGFQLVLTNPASVSRYRATNEGQVMQMSRDDDDPGSGPKVKF